LLILFQSTPPVPPPSNSGSSALKRKSPGDDLPIISASSNQGYGISQTLSTTNPGPQAWPNSSAQGRPTLTGGLPAGRISGRITITPPPAPS
jgi:transcription initiation factor TFIID subunit 12